MPYCFPLQAHSSGSARAAAADGAICAVSQCSALQVQPQKPKTAILCLLPRCPGTSLGMRHLRNRHPEAAFETYDALLRAAEVLDDEDNPVVGCCCVRPPGRWRRHLYRNSTS